MALYHYGLSRPPKNQRRRRGYAVGVLLLCVPLAPFVVLGAVQGWADGDVPGAAVLTLLAALCLVGVGSAVWALVDSFRSSGGSGDPERADGGTDQPSR